MTVFTKYLVTFDGRDAVQAAAAIRETSKYPIWGVWAGISPAILAVNSSSQ